MRGVARIRDSLDQALNIGFILIECHLGPAFATAFIFSNNLFHTIDLFQRHFDGKRARGAGHVIHLKCDGLR